MTSPTLNASPTYSTRQASAAARHLSYFAPRVPSGIWALGFGFCCSMSVLLAVTGIGQLALLSFISLAGLLVLCYPHLVLRANLSNVIFWLYPGWAFLSAGWSNIPDRTIHLALLLLPTFLTGITLGGIADRRAVNAGAATALTLYMLYAVATSATTAFSDTGAGGVALTGLSGGKNFFGHIAAMSLLMAPGLFSYAREKYGKVAVAIGLLGLAVSSYGLIGSHATGSLLAAIIGVATYPAVLLFRRINWQWRLVLLAATAGVLILYLTFGEELKDLIVQSVMAKFNKDTSLTGRTILWDFADRLIAQHRLIGYGYGSFWYYTNPDAWTVWRMMGIQPMSGFNFHNTFRETMIDGGLIGLTIYLASFGFAFVRTAVRSLRSGELVDAVRLSFIVYFVVRMPVETTGIGGPAIDSILLLAFLSIPSPLTVARTAAAAESMAPRFRTRARSVELRPSPQLR